MENLNATIQITSDTKERISLYNYETLSDKRQENIICALMVNLCASTNPIPAKDFLALYNWFVGTLYQGIIIDFNVYPQIKDSKLYEDVTSLAGDKSENLINRDSVMRVASLISCNDEAFAKALDFAYAEFEMKLLLFSFSPGCIV